MKTQEILKTTTHRPWDIPNKKWKFYQEWNDTIFMHWQVDLTTLEKFVPEALEIDLFEGKPWVSLVAFTLENLRPRGLPPFPPISNFYEINIRTYVRFKDKSGIYFLNIEAGKWLSSKMTKVFMELPYHYSKIKRSHGIYQSINTRFNDQLQVEYDTGKPNPIKSRLEYWLIERYALFQDSNDSINEFDIHHIEWPLNEMKITALNMNYPRFRNLINNHPDLSHYSSGVQVLTWNKHKNQV